jgi:NADP-dependent 3-hydroxy acid dehydrogenase YdfG
MTVEVRRKTMVVGATGGMGSAVALERARQGDLLILTGRNHSKLTEVAQRIGDENERPGILTVDLGDMESCAKCIRETVELMDGLDTLLFCSGVHVNARTTDADLPSWDHLLDVNFRSFVTLSVWVLNRSTHPGAAGS